MNIKTHEFEIYVGKITKGDESWWPDQLHILVSSDQALILIEQLARGISIYKESGDNIPLIFVGKLDHDIEED